IKNTSGGFLNDLLTPAVRFSPWETPLLGPMAPMVSSDCRESAPWPLGDSSQSHIHMQVISLWSNFKKYTCGNQSELVFLICDLLLFHISPWEEKSHHPFEELIHQLDGQRHHVHLKAETNKSSINH
uniref:Uncharacterized protein n=1 Tax=Mola mola TaxID=94237 RepID=A0A3Q4BHF2_MOLML